VVGSNSDLPGFLTSGSAPAGLRCLATGRSIWLFHYLRRFGRKSQHRTEVQFVVAQPEPDAAYVVVFLAPSNTWRSAVRPLIDSLYPRAALPFLTQGELQRSLKNIQRAAQPDRGVRVIRLSSRRRLETTARKRFQSTVEWTDADLDSVFREARETSDWFRSVSFELVAITGSLPARGTRGLLSKYGYFACTDEFPNVRTYHSSRPASYRN